METREFRHEVASVIVFTREELELIRDCCVGHYDARVKSAAGGGGFLYGWFNKLNIYFSYGDTEVEFTCRSSDLDTCGKALEQPARHELEGGGEARWALRASIMTVLRSINDETKRLNDVAITHRSCVEKLAKIRSERDQEEVHKKEL